ncbi:hypothetical protein EYC80_008542 [Monilinia laxa]|uniref:Uncharacterized protein n=1 Tax=Monilinia laxa TaxID=61186 RepID=A0A5N6JR72_MONLA|nr:hypothetical protein EYC80_008542 [Monilinia laxa]
MSSNTPSAPNCEGGRGNSASTNGGSQMVQDNSPNKTHEGPCLLCMRAAVQGDHLDLCNYQASIGEACSRCVERDLPCCLVPDWIKKLWDNYTLWKLSERTSTGLSMKDEEWTLTEKTGERLKHNDHHRVGHARLARSRKNRTVGFDCGVLFPYYPQIYK